MPRAKLRESDAPLFRFVFNLHQATHFYRTNTSHTGGEQVRAEGPMRSELGLKTLSVDRMDFN